MIPDIIEYLKTFLEKIQQQLLQLFDSVQMRRKQPCNNYNVI
jgi:hypothetical protein